MGINELFLQRGLNSWLVYSFAKGYPILARLALLTGLCVIGKTHKNASEGRSWNVTRVVYDTPLLSAPCSKLYTGTPVSLFPEVQQTLDIIQSNQM